MSKKAKPDFIIEREKLNHKSKFNTCEGDSIFLVSDWLKIHEEIVDRSNVLFEYGETFVDGESDLQDTKRVLRYFIFRGRRWPLTEFGICGTDYDVQIISFENIIRRQYYGYKLPSKKEIHFINGYNMNPNMEWMLIEIDKEKNKLRVFECNPKCVW